MATRTPKHRAISKGDRVVTPHGVGTVLAIDLDTLTGARELVMVESPDMPGYGRYVRLADCLPIASL